MPRILPGPLKEYNKIISEIRGTKPKGNHVNHVPAACLPAPGATSDEDQCTTSGLKLSSNLLLIWQFNLVYINQWEIHCKWTAFQ